MFPSLFPYSALNAFSFTNCPLFYCQFFLSLPANKVGFTKADLQGRGIYLCALYCTNTKPQRIWLKVAKSYYGIIFQILI